MINNLLTHWLHIWRRMVAPFKPLALQPVPVRAIALTGLMTALWVGTALAVHETNLFQLDGNAQKLAGVGDDWDTLFPTNTSTTTVLWCVLGYRQRGAI